MRFIIICYVLIFSLFQIKSLTAQIRLEPLTQNEQLIENSLNRSKNNSVCSTLRLNLPFFDDFSIQTSLFPNCDKWQDHHVFVNQTMAYAPPSIGVASFDGLNADGRPYDITSDPNTPLSADTLTSQEIDLSGKDSSDRIVLSFFLQQQGLADRPESNDSFIVEFKNNLGNWILIKRYAGVSNLLSSLLIPEFRQEFISIHESEFLHNSFQFRFRNKASVSGNNDHWHLDYVYLDQNRSDTVAPVYYNDITFTQVPVNALKKYTAVPWNHFSSTMWNDSLLMQTYNHSSQSGAFDRTYYIYDSAQLTNPILQVSTPSFNYTPSPNVRDDYDTILTNAFGPFIPTARTALISIYEINNPNSFQNNPIFFKNDTVTKYTILDNYFAYDDGIPEMRAILQGVGTQIAVEFQSTIQDSLRGIYFHLPYYINRDAEQDFINVKVWLDSLGNEVFTKDIYRLRYVGGLGGMHYVELTDFDGNATPIGLNAGQKFFVGWQQASTYPVPVGVDRNNDRDDKTFIKVGGNAWVNTEIDCALMIRPLVSNLPNPVIIGTEVNESINQIQIFPNPSFGQLFFQLNDLQLLNQKIRIELFDVLGQLQIEAPFAESLDISNLASGIYFLTMSDQKGKLFTKKIIKR